MEHRKVAVFRLLLSSEMLRDRASTLTDASSWSRTFSRCQRALLPRKRNVKWSRSRWSLAARHWLLVGLRPPPDHTMRPMALEVATVLDFTG
jgi:hypothetical protein